MKLLEPSTSCSTGTNTKLWLGQEIEFNINSSAGKMIFEYREMPRNIMNQLFNLPRVLLILFQLHINGGNLIWKPLQVILFSWILYISTQGDPVRCLPYHNFQARQVSGQGNLVGVFIAIWSMLEQESCHQKKPKPSPAENASCFKPIH